MPRRQQPDPRRKPLPYAVNLRLSDVAYSAVALEAEARGESISAVVRRHVDAAIDAAQMTRGPHAGKSLRQALEDDPRLTGHPEAPDAEA